MTERKEKFMYCTKCGMLNNDNALFCYGCGEKIEKPETINAQQEEEKNSQYIQNQSIQTQYISQTTQSNNCYQTPKKSLSPNIAGTIISLLLISSCFLPFISVGYSRYGETYLFFETGWGILALLAGIVAVVFSVFDKKKGIVIPGIVSIICYVIFIVSMISKYNNTGISLKDLSEMFGEVLHIKAGFIVVPACSIALIICGIMVGRDNIERKGTTEHLERLGNKGNALYLWKCCNCKTKNASYNAMCKCGMNKENPRNIIKPPLIKKMKSIIARGWYRILNIR